MRLALISLPLTIAIGAAGLYLIYLSQQPSGGTMTSEEDLGIRFTNKIHPVTQEMEESTRAKSKNDAPELHVKDFEGQAVQIGGTASKPQFVYFIQDGCPCSVDAEPLFQHLYKRFKEHVEFVAVIDTGADRAQRWSTEKQTPYSIVPDADKKVIHAYSAKSSAYSALVSTKGEIVKMWPGFSIEILKDMNANLAKSAGIKEEPFDTLYAPVEPRTGCAF